MNTSTVQSPSNNAERRRLRLTVTVAGVAALIDLGSKLTASRMLTARPIRLPGPIDLELSHNSGVAVVSDAVCRRSSSSR